MRKAELIADFRRATDDRAGAVRFSDDDILAWLREAEDEAAMRKKLLFEAANPSMCELLLTPGTQSYKLHPRWWLITNAWHLDTGSSPRYRKPLLIRSRMVLGTMRPDWRTDDTRPPWGMAIHGGTLQMAGWVERPGTITMEGYRLPMRPLGEQDESKPEIHDIHHRHLIDWALFRAYSVPDSEVLNPPEAQAALGRFEVYFGLRVDGDLLQETVDDQPHYNRGWY